MNIKTWGRGSASTNTTFSLFTRGENAAYHAVNITKATEAHVKRTRTSSIQFCERKHPADNKQPHCMTVAAYSMLLAILRKEFETCRLHCYEQSRCISDLTPGGQLSWAVSDMHARTPQPRPVRCSLQSRPRPQSTPVLSAVRH